MFTTTLLHGCESLNLYLCLGCMFTCSPPVCCRVANLFASRFVALVYVYCLPQGCESLDLYLLLWVLSWLPVCLRVANLCTFIFVALVCTVCLPPVWRRVANLTVSNCNIERLYGDVFRNLNVTRLIISVVTHYILFILSRRLPVYGGMYGMVDTSTSKNFTNLVQGTYSEWTEDIEHYIRVLSLSCITGTELEMDPNPDP